MTEIDQIKQNVDIFELAEKFGAAPNNNGKCKHNPLREERTPSLKLYRETNTYSDFGDKAGSVIDFYMAATNKNVKDAIHDLKDFANIQPVKNQYARTINSREYMTVEAIDKAFNSTFWSDLDITKPEVKDHILTVTPTYMLSECDKKDKKKFMSLAKWSKNQGTSVFKFPDREGKCHTFKYRYKTNEENGHRIKWYSQPNSMSSYLFCHLEDKKKKVLVVEGARDFLNGILLGFDVISLYSKNYKFTKDDFDLLKNRECIFMDDFGEAVIKEIYEKADCKKKIYFNHLKMRETTKCESKDLSDYLYKFKSLNEFMEVFNDVTKNNGDWRAGLKDLKTILTLEALNEIPDVEAIIDGFLFKGTASVIHSTPGQGKSIFLLSAIKKALNDGTIKDFVYFDADNPLKVLKNRIPSLQEIFKERMTYHSHTLGAKEDLLKEMNRLCTFRGQGQDTLIIVDTLSNFITNVNDDPEVSVFMQAIVDLRDKFGATVVLIHHSKKEKDNNDDVIFRGSSLIQGPIDFMWGLSRSGKKIKLKSNKGRFEHYEKIEVDIDIKTYDMEMNGSYNFEEEEESNNEESVTLDALVKFLKDNGESTRTSINKHFKATRATRPAEKERQDAIFQIIQDNRDKIEWNGVSSKGCKYKLKMQPEIIEYQDEEIESIFGNL